MKKIHITSLQQRLALLLLLPVGALLIVVGFAGYVYMRQVLLTQWQESALLKLERAAHVVDMRLSIPMERIRLFTAASDAISRQRVLDEIAVMQGVKRVQIEWIDKLDNIVPMRHDSPQSHHRMMQFHRVSVSSVSRPVLDADVGARTVSLATTLLDRTDTPVGDLLIMIDFDYLVKDILDFGWEQSDKACVIDRQGSYLLHTNEDMEGRQLLGENGNLLEEKLKSEIADSRSGTLMSSGHPPEEVVGYHALANAPWTIALFAPGEKILSPIVRFSYLYLAGTCLLIIFILMVIRWNLRGMVVTIQKLSEAAKRVAKGDYGKQIVRRTDDEMGTLIDSYNKMVTGLKERDHIRNTFGLYIDEDIARELLKRPDVAQLGGDKRDVVVLMGDIRGFTPLAESLSPEDTIRVLNHYFQHMIWVIKAHRGVIVDFVGDAILVFFDPLTSTFDKACMKAVFCGLEMQAEMKRMNEEIANENLPAISIGVGIHMGSVVVGNIGSDTRVKYGIVGSAVNLTQRIQDQASGGEVVVSDDLLKCLSFDLNVYKTVDCELKGVQEQIKLHYVSREQSGDR